MSEKKGLPSFINQHVEGFSQAPTEQNLAAKKERRLVTREVATLSSAELVELKQYLERQRININQPMLQTGVVSAGYAKFGAIELGGGKIAFVPNQNNERIVGTPQEFLQALKTLG